MNGKEILCAAFFYDENNGRLKNPYSSGVGYTTTDNAVVVGENGISNYDNCRWSDFKLFIPYEALNPKVGTNSLYCKIAIGDGQSNLLAISDANWFTYTQSEPQQHQTRRETYADGSYSDITENPDGTVSRMTYRTCNICHGGKRCNLCHGQGGQWGGHGQYRRYVICNSCGGNGACKYCGGTGTSVLASTYYPATGESFGRDLHTGNLSSSHPYRTDNSSSHSSGDTSTSRCSICNGTGYDKFAWEAGSQRPYVGGVTNYEGNRCSICGKTNWHQHVYCPKCNADKY